LTVHGIGEQKRFEHLDAQVREIVRGLVARTHAGESSKVTVEIFGGGFASFGAEHDTWASGDQATARVVFRDAGAQKVLHIYFHEVWWADVNEPYSLAKQVRFWMWGLVIAFIPRKRHSMLASASSSRDPIAPGGVLAARAVFDASLGCFLLAVTAPAFASPRPANLLALGITAHAALRLPLLPTVVIGVSATGPLRHALA
jgi:hypothetical protein